MTVYVETNFALELALQQEQHDACRKILEITTQGQVTLVVPAFSLTEPHSAIREKAKARNQLAIQLESHLQELSRSKPNSSAITDFEAFRGLLAQSAESARAGIRSVIMELLQTAEVIPTDSQVLRLALEIETEFEMLGQDAIVLASVLIDLKSRLPERSCFFNRNTKDFDDPSVRSRLEAHGCKFFGRFDRGLNYLLSTLDRT